MTVGVGHGKRAARNIDAWLRGTRVEPAPEPPIAEFETLNTWYYADAPRAHRSRLEAVRRQSSFDEVIQGFDEKLHETKIETQVAQDQGMVTQDVTALVAAGRPLIEHTIGRQRWPKISRRGVGSGRFDQRSFEAGHGNRGRLLPRTS